MDLLKPGQIFAERYRVERFLAQGGFGAVFVAEQVATELRVAIKVLWPHILGSQDAVDKFQLEARVAARVNSEHIVKVLDAGFDQTTGLPFLVMELLDGESLEAHLERRGMLSPAEVHSYLTQVAFGLDRAHGYVDKEGVPRPIVHRDLKPENLFLARRDGGGAVIKILDFGIAKVLSSTSNVSQEVKGTPLYMAHEQASGKGVSPRTDIWALGLIAFHLLSGRIYWRTAANPETGITGLFGEILALPIEPPSARVRELGQAPPWPPTFDAWFFRCVNRDVEARFASAGEAIRALGVALGISAPAVAPPSYAAESFAATAVAAPSTAGMSAPTLPSAPGAAAVPAITSNAMALSGNGGPVSSAPRRTGLVVAIAALVLAGGAAAAFALHGSTAPPREPNASAQEPTAPVATPEVRPAVEAKASPEVKPTVDGATPAGTPVPTVAPSADVTPTASATPPAPSVAVNAPATLPPPPARPARPLAGARKDPQPAPREPAAPAAAPAPAAAAAKPKADVYGER